MASEKQNKLKLQEIQLQKEYTEAKKEYLESLAIEADLLKDGIPFQEDQAKYFAEMKTNLESATSALDKYNKTLEKQKKDEEDLKKAREEQKQTAEGLAETLGGLLGLQSDYSETLASQITQTLKSGEMQDLFAKKLSKVASASNIAATAISFVVHQSKQLLIAQDKTLANFAKNGGNISRYNSELIGLEQSMFQYGVTSEEAGEAFLSLNRNFTDLRKLSSGSREQLAQTTAVLQELGISSDVTTENIQFMTKALGTTAVQAAQTQRELFVLARTIDMPPEQMAVAFQDAMPKLAAFGSESTEVFKKLQVNARAAGMEVSDVLSIVEQFDTFDSAAQSVGRLNAILGGPFLDSLEMVTTTDPTERMRMLSDAVNDAGLSFDEMSYYQTKALADTMGMDIPQLAQMMANGFDEAVPGAKKSQAEILALAEEAKQFQTVMDELAQTGRLLAVSLLPLAKALKVVLNGLQWIMATEPGMQQFFALLVLSLSAVTLAVTGLTGASVPLMALLIPVGVMMVALSDASFELKVGIMGVTIAVGAVTLALWHFNIATAGLPFAIAAIVSGLIGLAYVIMHKAASPGMIAIIGLFAIAIVALLPVLAPAALAIGAIAASLMAAAMAMKMVMSLAPGLGSALSTATESVGEGETSKSKIRSANEEKLQSNKRAQATATKERIDLHIHQQENKQAFTNHIVKVVKETNNNSVLGLKINQNVVHSKTVTG